jgi:hypothetical protein
MRRRMKKKKGEWVRPCWRCEVPVTREAIKQVHGAKKCASKTSQASLEALKSGYHRDCFRASGQSAVVSWLQERFPISSRQINSRHLPRLRSGLSFGHVVRWSKGRPPCPQNDSQKPTDRPQTFPRRRTQAVQMCVSESVRGVTEACAVLLHHRMRARTWRKGNLVDCLSTPAAL